MANPRFYPGQKDYLVQLNDMSVKLDAVVTGGAVGDVLCAAGEGDPPVWGKVILTTHVSGTLGTANGGTGKNTNYTQWGVVYASAGTALTNTAAGAAKTVLVGNGSAAPTFSTLDLTYIPDATLKKSVKAATTANLAGTRTGNVITANSVGVLPAVDGVTLALNDRVLVKNQTAAADNGPYYVSNVGSASVAWTLTRVADADTAAECSTAVVAVDSGTTNGGHCFTTSFKATDTLNTTAMNWYRVVDMADVDATAAANKIALRDSNGDVTARYMTMTHTSTSRTSDTVFYSSSDDYIKKNDATGFKTSLGLNNVDNKSSATIRGEITSDNVTTALGWGTTTFGIKGLGGIVKTSSHANWNDDLPSGFYEYDTATNGPGSGWYNMINVRHSNRSSQHGFQIAGAYLSNTLYHRNYSGGTSASTGTFSGWSKIWSEATDGSGSGLDADLLDGNHATAFLRSNADNPSVTGSIAFDTASERQVRWNATGGGTVGFFGHGTAVGLYDWKNTKTVFSYAHGTGELQLGGSTVPVKVMGDLTVVGILTHNGGTLTVNATTVQVDDPIITLGGDTAPTSDDNKDRGIGFSWHNGTAAKVGFFGFDDSTGRFTFIPDATNASEVFSGTKGDIDVGNIYSTNTVNANNLLMQGDGTNAYIRPTNANSMLYLGAVSTNTVSINTNTMWVAGYIVANSTIVSRGGTGTEGGQITLGYANNVATSINNEGNNTWNIDVQGTGSNLRIFRTNGSGTTIIPIIIAETDGKITTSGDLAVGGALTATSPVFSSTAIIGGASGGMSVLRGGTGAGGYGGHLIIGMGSNLAPAITGNADNTWNLQADSDHSLRLWRWKTDQSTAIIIPLRVKMEDGAVEFGNDFKVAKTANADRFIQVAGGVAGTSAASLGVAGGGSLNLYASSGNVIRFCTSGATTDMQAVIGHVTNAVNYVEMYGAATGSGPNIRFNGSDANVQGNFRTKAGGAFVFMTNDNVIQATISHTASAVNYLQAKGSATGVGVELSAQGSDTNVSLLLIPKGSGQVTVSSNTLRVTTAFTPATAAAAGVQGSIAWDASYVYVCVATNTWKRATLSSW